MPIDYNRYPPNWKQISCQVREAAGWKCEWCGAKNGESNPATGSKVVLTVAHLGTDFKDGTPGDKTDKMDVRLENLAALCQRCHLRFDIDEHKTSAAETRRQRELDAGQLELGIE